MSRILEDAIGYAREGFPLSAVIAQDWAASIPLLGDQPGSFRATFAPEGTEIREGAVFRNPDLGVVLDAIATGGREAFYEGWVADRIDHFFRQHEGYLRKEDLGAHRSEWVEPLSVSYRGYEVYELPPNTQGVAALQMLNMLEEIDLRGLGPTHPEALHWMIEVKKLAFADRAAHFADPAFARADLKGLLDKAYARDRLSLVNPRLAGPHPEAGHPAVDEGDTVYLCTADASGCMVSLIQSNFRGMGSGIVVPGLGFGLQNRGELFCLEAGHANVYAPGKRPFHTIIPALVMKDGDPLLAFGVMGGAFQPQGHVQILVQWIDHGMGIQEAGDFPRWQHLGSPEPTGEGSVSSGWVELESGFPWATVRDLLRRKHDLRYGLGGFGGYQAIARHPSTGVLTGATESRKDGLALGF